MTILSVLIQIQTVYFFKPPSPVQPKPREMTVQAEKTACTTEKAGPQNLRQAAAGGPAGGDHRATGSARDCRGMGQCQRECRACERLKQDARCLLWTGQKVYGEEAEEGSPRTSCHSMQVMRGGGLS